MDVLVYHTLCTSSHLQIRSRTQTVRSTDSFFRMDREVSVFRAAKNALGCPSIQENHLNFQPYFPVSTAAMPKATAKPMRKYRAMLLRSKNPLPVTVTAPMTAMTANTAIITLAILQMVLFTAILQIISGFINRNNVLPGDIDDCFLLAFGAAQGDLIWRFRFYFFWLQQ